MESKYLFFSDKYFWHKISSRHLSKGGVYKVIAMKEGKPVPINRFLGTDESGVLYIGKANSFINRVVELKKAISPSYRGTSHICGRRYKSIPNIASRFPYEILCVELIETESPEATEMRFLIEYTNTFGERPPLNAI